MHGILLGLTTGAIVAATWIYAMQPNVIYPEWVLTTFDHPWTLLVFLLTILYIGYKINLQIGALLFLMFIALVLDLSAFGRNGAVRAPRGETASTAFSPGGTGDNYGTTVVNEGPYKAIAEPDYPMFYGVHDLQPGEPAGF